MFLSTCRVVLSYQKCVLPLIIQVYPSVFRNSIKRIAAAHRPFCTGPDSKDIAKTSAKKERTKTVEVPKITLLDTNDNIICVTTIIEAERMAIGKNLKLVKIVDKDVRTVRPVFKLMSEAEYIQEDLKLRKQRKDERKKGESFVKGEKMIIISSKITTSDLNMKINKILKFLEKKYEVHILISGSPDSNAAQEDIFKKIETPIKDKSRIVQKIYKSGNLKFNVLPLRDKDEEKTKEGSEKKKIDTNKLEAV